MRTLQAAFPAASITWIIGTVEHSLLSGADGIEFITFDKNQGLPGLLTVRRKLAGRQFDLLLHMHASMRANLVSMVVNAQRRIGFDRFRARDYQWLFTNEAIAARDQQHVLDGLFGFAEYLGIHDRHMRWDIPVSDADKQYAAALRVENQPVCVISPCSSFRARNFRNWSISNYIQLISYLRERHNAVVILTGASSNIERTYGEALSAAASPELINLIGQTSLKRLLAILSEADLLICPDSGPAHMATAVGTPVVGLYATSNRWRTGPYLSQHTTVDRYPDAIEAEFNKPVDEVRWGQRVRDPEAMNLITLEDAQTQVDSLLDT